MLPSKCTSPPKASTTGLPGRRRAASRVAARASGAAARCRRRLRRRGCRRSERGRATARMSFAIRGTSRRRRRLRVRPHDSQRVGVGSDPVRKGIVQLVAIGVVIAIAVTLVAVLFQWLPTSASEEFDRIQDIYWFATVMSIVIFALVVGRGRVLGLEVASPARRRRRRPADPRPHGARDRVDGRARDPRDRARDRQCVRACPRTARHVTMRSRSTPSASSSPGSSSTRTTTTCQSGELVLPVDQAGALHDGGGRRPPLVLGAELRPEDGRRARDRDRDHRDSDANVGEYEVVCAELCGLGHATMRAKARVVTQAEFDQWVQEQQA